MPCFAICESTLALTTYSVLVLAVTAHETRPCRRLTASCSCRHPLLSTRLLRSAGLVTGIAPVPFDQKPSCIQWSSPPAHHCSTCSSAACRSFQTIPPLTFRTSWWQVTLHWNLQISVKLQHLSFTRSGPATGPMPQLICSWLPLS